MTGDETRELIRLVPCGKVSTHSDICADAPSDRRKGLEEDNCPALSPSPYSHDQTFTVHPQPSGCLKSRNSSSNAIGAPSGKPSINDVKSMS